MCVCESESVCVCVFFEKRMFGKCFFECVLVYVLVFGEISSCLIAFVRKCVFL